MNYEKALTKSSWKPYELGRMNLANVSIDHAHNNKGHEKTAFMSDDQYNRMLETFYTEKDFKTISNYDAVIAWLKETVQLTQAHSQQAQVYLEKLRHYIGVADTAETVNAYIAKLPYTMTEKEYKDKKEEAMKPLLKNTWDIMHLISRAFHYYRVQLEKEPEAPNPLKELKPLLEKEIVTEERILNAYNTIARNGYYELPDGTRSDKVSYEEWAEKAGLKTLSESEQKEQDRQNALTEAEYMYNLEVPSVMGEMYRLINDAKRNAERVEWKWHEYKDTPAGLNKWDVLEVDGFFALYICGTCELDPDGKEIEACRPELLNEEYPQLTKAILKAIEETYPAFKGISEKPVSEWLEKSYSWELLHELDFYEFDRIYLNDIDLFRDNERIVRNGISILKEDSSPNTEDSIDKAGHYIAPDITEEMFPYSIQSYFHESEDSEDLRDDIETYRRRVIGSLYFVKGFNKCLELIAEMTKVPEVELYSVDIPNTLNNLRLYNESIYLFYKKIDETNLDNKQLKAEKLKTLKEVFRPIKEEEFTPPMSKVVEAKANIKNFKGFLKPKFDPYLALCMNPCIQ